MSKLREDKDSEILQKSNLKENNKINIIRNIDLNRFNINSVDENKNFIRFIIINKKKRIIIFTPSEYNNNNKLIINSPLNKINIHSYLRILKLMSSKKEEKSDKKSINHYKEYIIFLINYFKNEKSKVENEIINTRSDTEKNQIISEIENDNIKNKEKNKKVNKNAKKECDQLIEELIRKIIHIKRLYLYTIVKQHYCKDIQKKEKIIKEGSDKVDNAKKNLEQKYKQLIIILKKRFKGDNALIIEYIRLIIQKLKKLKISENEIQEIKKLYNQDNVKFETLKEEEKDEKGEESDIKEKEKREKIEIKDKDKENLAINNNLNGRYGGYYRIWGVILPLLYIGHYLYSNFKIINN